MLHGTILKESVAPLTYNSATQQSSSFLITIVASVTLNGRDGKVLYENNNYVFREQYQSTTDLATFIQEDPGGRRAALARVCAAACGRCAGRAVGSRSGEEVTNPGAPGCEFGQLLALRTGLGALRRIFWSRMIHASIDGAARSREL